MIPLVDLRGHSPEKTASLLCSALRDVGFLYVCNHGIDPKMQSELLAVSRRFFALPLECKNEISMYKAGRAWRGYFPVGGELTQGVADIKEGIYFGADHPADHPGVLGRWPMHGLNLWPIAPECAHMKKLVGDYMTACSALGQRLMEWIAIGLGLTPDYFSKRFTSEPTLLFRVFNYPDDSRHAEASLRWGVAEHTDMGFLTLLLQDELGGLEVQRRDGTWTPAPPLDGTLVVNIGDMLEYWTHGIFRATPHRVRNRATRDRLSFPFFFDPNWTSGLMPIERELLSAGDLEAVCPEIKERWDGLDLHRLTSQTTYGDFVWEKIRAVFPSLAEN